MSHDRPSWLKPDAAADRELAELLDAGRGEQPSAAQRAELAERLAPTFGGPRPSGGGGSAAPVANAAPWTLVLAAAVALLALGSGAWWLTRERGGSAGASRTALVRAASEQAPAAEANPLPAAEAIAGAPSVVAAETAVPADPPNAVVAESSAQIHPRRAQASPANAPVRLDAVAELSLLDAAERALAATPARALALTAQHVKQFPAGQLVQERELLAIEALLRLGKMERAQARGRAFLARYPGSSHAPRCRELLQRAGAATTP